MTPSHASDTGQPRSAPPSPTRATIVIGDAPVTILPKRAPVGNSGPIRGRTLAVFPDPPATAATIVRLLPEHPPERFAATIEPGARLALVVADLGEREAAAIGQVLGLRELLFWDGRRAHLLDCDTLAPPLPPQGAGLRGEGASG